MIEMPVNADGVSVTVGFDVQAHAAPPPPPSQSSEERQEERQEEKLGIHLMNKLQLGLKLRHRSIIRFSV